MLFVTIYNIGLEKDNDILTLYIIKYNYLILK